jgi:hypothetical protein
VGVYWIPGRLTSLQKWRCALLGLKETRHYTAEIMLIPRHSRKMGKWRKLFENQPRSQFGRWRENKLEKL